MKHLVPGGDPAAGDQIILDRREQEGADLSRPRNIRHYLYFPTRSAASQAAQAFQVLGFSGEVREGADHKNWLALAQGATTVNRASVADMRKRLTELASILKGEYDGWEASPEP
jgi:hypothetical protein